MPQTRNELKLRILIVIVIVFIASVIRIRAVNALPIDIDEPTYLNAGLGYTQLIREGDIKGIAWYDKNAEHPALVKMVYGMSFLPLSSINEIQEKDLVYGAPVQATDANGWLYQGRYVTMLFGVATVALLTWLSPAAGLLLAVQTSAVRYTSQIGLEALPALTALMCVLAYEQWLKEEPDGLGKPGWSWLVLSSVTLGLTASSKYVYCVVALVILIHLVWQTWQKKWHFSRALQMVLLWGGLSVLIFFITDPYLWPKPVGRLMGSINYHFVFASSEHVAKYEYPFWQPLLYLSQTAGQNAPYLIRIDFPVLLLAGLGLYPLRKKPLHFIWLIVSLLFLLVWKTKWPQYTMVVLVPYCMAAAEGVKVLWNWGKKRMTKGVT